MWIARILSILIPLAILWYGSKFAISHFQNKKKKAAYEKWQKANSDPTTFTIARIISDMRNTQDVISMRLPVKAQQQFIKIIGLLQAFENNEASFSAWKEQDIVKTTRFLDILYKHLPGTIERYCSIPESARVLNSEGKNADDALVKTFNIFYKEINGMVQEIISRNINSLHAYGNFVKSKYED